MLTAEDIVSENPTAVALRATAAVSWAFRHFNIFLGNQPQLPVNPAMVIEVPKAAVMEEYAAFPGARRLYSIGAFSYAMCNEASLAMGRYCSVAHNVSVLGERHGMEWLTTSPLIYHFGPHTTMPAFNAAQAQLMGGENKPNFPPGRFGPFPVLGHDVWVGQNVVLARGITIGTGAVIAAGAVVTSDVAPYTIVGGVPARVIRLRFPMELAARLLASRWWDYHPEMLAKFNVADPAAFMDAFDEAQGAGTLRFLDVRRITWRDLLGVDDPDRFNKKTMVD